MVKKIDRQILSMLNATFKNIYYNSIDIFKDDFWKVLYVDNASFLDEDVYPKIKNIFKELGNNNILIVPVIPNDDFNFRKGYSKLDYLTIKCDTNYNDFTKLVREYNFDITGGYFISENKKVAGYILADIDLLIFGFERNIESIVKENFKNFKYLISEQIAKERLNIG